MPRMNACHLLGVVLGGVLLASNCASAFRSKTQGIPVTSFPAGAAVIVNGTPQGVTPIEIRLKRGQKGQVIRIESPGYAPVEIRLTRRISAGPIIGNLLIGLIPGVIVGHVAASSYSDDGINLLGWAAGTVVFGAILTSLSGEAGFELVPNELTVTLKKADGPPRVDTILFDADDFRNVVWIRVRRD